MTIPKEISIRISANMETLNGKAIPKVRDERKEIEARRNIFSGEDFKL